MSAVPGPVAIVGLGALGGSLARALAALPDPPELRGSSLSAADRDAAAAAGVVARASDDPAEAAAGARWLVVAVPLGATADVLRRAAPGLAEDALVLDVGSLQAPALDAAEEACLETRFVSCHPMAGTEASGFAAGRVDLFHDARVGLAATPDLPDGGGAAVEAFWTALEARPAWTSPEEHDARMVVASHLPQLASNALAHVLAHGGLTPEDLGPGGLDMTRLAASDPGIWRDLLTYSGPQAAALLRVLARELEGWARSLDGQDLDDVARRMAATRRWRAP